MEFHIGPWVYRVRIVPKIFDDCGKELSGQTIAELREIHIAAWLPAPARWEILLHELKHTWNFHVPRARTDEEDCDFTATVAAAAHADLEGQGGLDALEAMRPATAEPPLPERGEPVLEVEAPDAPDDFSVLRLVNSVESTAKSSGKRAQCARCDTIIAGGSIVNARPRFDTHIGGLVIDRTLYCGHCDHLQKWTEGATPDGAPNGAVASDAVFVTGAAVEQFIREHSEATALVAV